jgi:chromate transport protein ChrA
MFHSSGCAYCTLLAHVYVRFDTTASAVAFNRIKPVVIAIIIRRLRNLGQKAAKNLPSSWISYLACTFWASMKSPCSSGGLAVILIMTQRLRKGFWDICFSARCSGHIVAVFCAIWPAAVILNVS